VFGLVTINGTDGGRDGWIVVGGQKRRRNVGPGARMSSVASHGVRLAVPALFDAVCRNASGVDAETRGYPSPRRPRSSVDRAAVFSTGAD